LKRQRSLSGSSLLPHGASLFALALRSFGGTGSAEHKDGKHEMKRAPAAITSLSVACRCASRPPSDPSV